MKKKNNDLWIYIYANVAILFVGITLILVIRSPLPDILQEVGYSLIGAGFTAILLLGYLISSQNTDEERSKSAFEELSTNLVEKISKLQSYSLISKGIKEVYDDRSLRDQFQTATDNVKGDIEVVGFGLGNFYVRQWPKIIQKLPTINSVKILLIDPSSPFCERSLLGEMAGDVSSINEKIEKWCKSYQELSEQKPSLAKKVEIRLYRNMPSFGYFRVDDTIYFGPNFDIIGTERTPTFEVVGKTLLFRDIKNMFDAVWNESKPINQQ